MMLQPLVDAHCIPPSIPDDDAVLLDNLLTALQSLQGPDNTPLCAKYKVEVAPTCYVVRAVLPADAFEFHVSDLLFLQSISPARIEHMAIARRPGAPLELVMRVLDCKQRIIVTSTVSFSSSQATRKRKWSPH